jgi:hypothetical protein
MSTFNTSSTVLEIKSEENASIVSIISSKDVFSTLSFYNKQTVELEIEPPQVTSNHVNNFLGSSRFAWFIKNQEYTEIDESCLEILNHDWSLRPYYRVASGQLLSSTILVERGQILLINGVELYCRDATAGPHHERFGSKFMIVSNPTLFNRYEYKVNIISKIEDQSSKLIIGTNGLTHSSLVKLMERRQIMWWVPAHGIVTFSSHLYFFSYIYIYFFFSPLFLLQKKLFLYHTH